MKKFNDDLKGELRARGLWGDVLARRDELKAANPGANAREIIETVVKELAPDLIGMVRPVDPRCPVNRGAEKTEKKIVPTKRRVGVDADVGVGAPRAFRITKETFKDKSCPITVAFMWAYETCGVSDITPDDAPSAAAWQLRCDMIASPAFRYGISQNTIVAKLKKQDDEGGGRFDGEGEYDINAAIAAAGGSE